MKTVKSRIENQSTLNEMKSACLMGENDGKVEEDPITFSLNAHEMSYINLDMILAEKLCCLQRKHVSLIIPTI